MFSADFKAGLIRVAGFGRKVLSVPEDPAVAEHPQNDRWRLFAVGGVTLALLLTGAWYAGRESAGLEAQRVSAQLDQLAQQVASTQLALKQQKAKTDQLEKGSQASGEHLSLLLQAQLRQQLLKAQAEANEYKTIIERQREVAGDNARLLDALSTPGTHLLPLKGTETAADATAYALLIANSRLLFVGFNLPSLADGRQFQLWVVRKEDPKVVSAGVFTPDDNNQTIMSFDDASLLSDISLLELTEEPEGGSSAPTGTKLLETPPSAVEPTRASPAPSEGISGVDLRAEPSLPYQHRGISR